VNAAYDIDVFHENSSTAVTDPDIEPEIPIDTGIDGPLRLIHHSWTTLGRLLSTRQLVSSIQQPLMLHVPLDTYPCNNSTITLQNDGGANFFIFNDSSAFWNFQAAKLSVRQIDRSSIAASGFGVVAIHPPISLHLLALWPSYYFTTAPQYRVSSNALNHYLILPSVTTKHTSHLNVTLSSDIVIHFPSIPSTVVTSGLDFFHADVVKPSHSPLTSMHSMTVLPAI
jgi:hypothetical protein